jgi:hypothetical protein
MGNFYTNVTLYRADRAKALAVLKGRKAAVSPMVGKFTIIWDEESEAQDVNILEAVTKRLSRELGCPAWAVLNHDDDVLLYMLFSGGENLDQYNSCPGYFGGSGSGPEGGNAAVLAKTFGTELAAKSVETVLRDQDGYAFAIDRHQALIEALGMPSFGVGIGYRYITSGECPPGLENADEIAFSE